MNTKIGLRQVDQKIVLGGIIVVIIIVMSFLSPKFLELKNFENILLQIAPLVIIASAANLLMVSGNFDLSVGGVYAFCAIMHAYMTKHGIPIVSSILIACIFAIIWGVLNGVMVGVLNVNPVIATISTMYSASGFAYLIARWDGGANIAAGLPTNFSAFGRTNVFGVIPIIIIIMIIFVVIFIIIERKTVLGRYSYAIGGNRQAAKLSGINIPGVIIILYAIVGLLAGLTGVIQVSRVGSAFPNFGAGLEFDVLIAIVLGGTSILGGEGTIFGMLIGASIIGLVANGLNLMNVPYFYQELTNGLILIIAVLINQLIRNRKRA
jgi:ribose transport system permease protein